MSRRKSPQANLEERRKIYFPLGLIVACSMALGALEWTNFDYLTTATFSMLPEEALMEEVIMPFKPKVERPQPVKREKLVFSPIVPPKPTPVPNPTPNPVPDPGIDPFSFGDDFWGDLYGDDGDDGGDDGTVFIAVERMPFFKVCENYMDKVDEKQCTDGKIIRYISQNVKYPRYLAEAGVGGTVHATFVVGSDGKTRDVEILRSVHPKLDQAVIDVILSMPEFVPGHQQGRDVSVMMSIPVVFRTE